MIDEVLDHYQSHTAAPVVVLKYCVVKYRWRIHIYAWVQLTRTARIKRLRTDQEDEASRYFSTEKELSAYQLQAVVFF